MVLYVLSVSKAPVFFPELSSTLMERSRHEEIIRLDAIILKACQPATAQKDVLNDSSFANGQGAVIKSTNARPGFFCRC